MCYFFRVAFKEALQLNSGNPFALKSYGTALAKAKQHEQAFKKFEEALQLSPQNSFVLKSYGSALAKAKRYKQAFEKFEEALQLNPQNTFALNSYARTLLKAKKHKEAVQQVEKLFQLNPKGVIMLASYARALAKAGHFESAFVQFERSLQVKSDDPLTLNSYGRALAKAGQYERAFEKFERSLQIKPQLETLNSYAKILAKAGQYERAFEMFERSLQIKPLLETLNSYAKILAKAGKPDMLFKIIKDKLLFKPDDSVMWASYGRALANAGQYERALDKFEHSLRLNPEDTATSRIYRIVLTSYGRILAKARRIKQACKMFERSLQLKSDDTFTLTSYGTVLANAGYFEQAPQMFERSLQVNPDDTVTLNSYGSALANAGHFEQARQQFERSLQLNPDNTVTLTSYGSVLANAGRYEEAFMQFERSLQVKPDDDVTLNSYGSALANAGHLEQACQLFERSLQVKRDNHITLFLYAVMLEKGGDYQEAISKLEEIALNELPQGYADFLRLNLGRLCYLIQEKERGNLYFELVIQNAPRDDLARLRTALNILVVEPYSEEAIEFLQQITEESPHYKQAFRMLSLNLTPKAYFEMFKESVQDEWKDTAMLNRSMYHKIKNEIGILKGLVYEILDTDDSQDAMFTPIIEGIEYIFDEIARRRKVEEADLTQIPHDDYKKMLQLISQTAHDIADFVNNEVAIIESDVRFSLEELKERAPFYEELTELLEQLELTQSALNDLKSLNEGIKIHQETFKVVELFEAWHNNQTFQHATIKLNIQNGEAEFEGDKAKIRSFVNELVDNALKHNPDQADLTIRITSRDEEGLPQDVIGASRKQRRWISSEKKYLAIIVSDDGQGIPSEKKNWIFVPLNTTSSDGSGLGLFIIQKTLAMMHGYILERGTQGASFELYIPYGGEN